MSHSFRFRRAERLKNFRTLSELFKTGKTFSAYPLRVFYLKVKDNAEHFPNNTLAQFALSVSKRKFAHAVDRNRIRRQIRESYRLNKHTLYAQLEQQDYKIALMVIYVAKKQLPYKDIEKAMKKIIKGISTNKKDSKL